jgi:hypothetical protein
MPCNFLQVNTDHSEEYAASIFKVDICWFKNMIGYIIQKSYKEGGHETQGNAVSANGKKWTKTDKNSSNKRTHLIIVTGWNTEHRKHPYT